MCTMSYVKIKDYMDSSRNMHDILNNLTAGFVLPKKIKATIKLLNEIDKALEKKYHESLAFDIRERYTKSKYEIISVLDELSKQDKDCLEDVIKMS